jgi:uncharacterized protein YjbJ (UPF0337 family)
MLICFMRRSTKNQIKGRGRALKGTIKEKTGRATHNPDLQARGAMERVGGKIQKKAGDIEKDLEEEDQDME